MSTAIIKVKDLHYTYPDGVEALKGVSFDVWEGECLGVVGPNGAGKSTLLLHLNGLLKGSSPDGETPVLIKGAPISDENLKEVRRTVGLVFQDPDDQLFSPTVFDDVAFGPLNLGLNPDEVRRRVRTALKAMGLEGYENRSSHHLSFGEKKRVAIATVLATSPEVLVLDEPTANLDPLGRWELIELLKGLPQTKIIASHDLEMIRELCDRVVLLNGGRSVAVGPTERILNDRELLVRSRLLPGVATTEGAKG